MPEKVTVRLSPFLMLETLCVSVGIFTQSALPPVAEIWMLALLFQS